MEIQTFECETMPNEECSEQAFALVEKLGAAKQAEVYYNATRQVVPYRKMTPTEHAVYKLLFPIREAIDKYDAGPIPLRVLQVGAHAKEVLESGTLVIWHQGVGKDDPILTLRVGSEYSGSYYLLARWGTALEEFAVLQEQAVKKFALAAVTKLHSLKLEVDHAMANAELLCRKALEQGKTDEPTFYWHI